MRNSQQGQILLIVVLTMVVALTVGLSIASRTITNLKISRQNEESQKAFQAAEAAIEKILAQENPANLAQTGLDNNALYSAQVDAQQAPEVALNGGGMVDQDKGTDVWISQYNENPSLAYTSQWTGSLTFYWGDPDTNATCGVTSGSLVVPALEVVVLTGTKADPAVRKYVFDPCTASRIGDSDTVTTSTTNILGYNYPYNSGNVISITNGLIMKVIPLYNSSRVAVRSSNVLNPLPPQGISIESTGVAGQTQRKIVYYESYPQIPNEVFPYAILSQ